MSKRKALSSGYLSFATIELIFNRYLIRVLKFALWKKNNLIKLCAVALVVVFVLSCSKENNFVEQVDGHTQSADLNGRSVNGVIDEKSGIDQYLERRDDHYEVFVDAFGISTESIEVDSTLAVYFLVDGENVTGLVFDVKSPEGTQTVVLPTGQIFAWQPGSDFDIELQAGLIQLIDEKEESFQPTELQARCIPCYDFGSSFWDDLRKFLGNFRITIGGGGGGSNNGGFNNGGSSPTVGSFASGVPFSGGTLGDGGSGGGGPDPLNCIADDQMSDPTFEELERVLDWTMTYRENNILAEGVDLLDIISSDCYNSTDYLDFQSCANFSLVCHFGYDADELGELMQFFADHGLGNPMRCGENGLFIQDWLNEFYSPEMENIINCDGVSQADLLASVVREACTSGESPDGQERVLEEEEWVDRMAVLSSSEFNFTQAQIDRIMSSTIQCDDFEEAAFAFLIEEICSSSPELCDQSSDYSIPDGWITCNSFSFTPIGSSAGQMACVNNLKFAVNAVPSQPFCLCVTLPITRHSAPGDIITSGNAAECAAWAMNASAKATDFLYRTQRPSDIIINWGLYMRIFNLTFKTKMASTECGYGSVSTCSSISSGPNPMDAVFVEDWWVYLANVATGCE